MPIGPYKNFAACVAANGDKRDPDAYCGSIEKKINNSEHTGHTFGILDAINPLFIGGLPLAVTQEARGVETTSNLLAGGLPAMIARLIRKLKDRRASGEVGLDDSISKLENAQSSGKFVEGDRTMDIEVFRTGTHIDSAGVQRKWVRDDLLNMVKAFDANVPGRVPLKIGHTSDEFNQKVATALNIPTVVLSGEGGEGAASLGAVTGLRADGDVLRAVVDVPPPMTALIDDNLFTDVSAEIFDQRADALGNSYGPVLSAIAVLGAQRPAVKELAGLQSALTYRDGSAPDRLLMFTAKFEDNKHDNETEEEKKKRLAKEKEARRKPFVEGAHREAVIASPVGLHVSMDRVEQAERIAKAAVKDGLLSGTVQRTGLGNMIRQVWSEMQDTFGKIFKERANQQINGQVVSIALPKSSYTTRDDVSKRVGSDFTIMEFQEAWIARSTTPLDTDKSIVLYYKVDSDGVRTTFAKNEHDEQFEQHDHTDQGDLDMVTEAQIREALRIGPSDDIMGAVTKLQSNFTERSDLAERVANMEHDKRVSRYREHTTQLRAMAGTADENATRLAEIEEKFGKDEAAKLLTSWQTVDAAAKASGVLSTISSRDPNENTTHPFEDKVRKHAEDNKMGFPEALVALSRSDPSGFAEYSRNQGTYTQTAQSRE